MSRPTMQQIADELGMSRRTVSSVVNDRARERGISERTAERVREYLARRGYVPSRSACVLRATRHESIGILYQGHLYSHLIPAFNMLVERLRGSPTPLEMMVVKPDAVVKGLREMVGRGVSRLVWIQASTPERELTSHEEALAYFSNFETAVVYNHRFDRTRWDRVFADKGIHMVGVDRNEGFRRLGRMLLRLRHSKVLLPCSEATARGMRALDGLAAAGLEVTCSYPEGVTYGREADSSRASAENIARIAAGRRVTAVCFLDDEIAGFTMAELLRLGLRIPQDLTVTGFDGMPFAASFAVPLTTLAVPVERMVRRVAKLVAGSSPARKRHRFKLDLVERSSHGPAPKRRSK